MLRKIAALIFSTGTVAAGWIYIYSEDWSPPYWYVTWPVAVVVTLVWLKVFSTEIMSGVFYVFWVALGIGLAAVTAMEIQGHNALHETMQFCLGLAVVALATAGVVQILTTMMTRRPRTAAAPRDIDHRATAPDGGDGTHQRCRACNGAGQWMQDRRVSCQMCAGSGRYYDQMCLGCGGSGTQNKMDMVRCRSCGGRGYV